MAYWNSFKLECYCGSNEVKVKIINNTVIFDCNKCGVYEEIE